MHIYMYVYNKKQGSMLKLLKIYWGRISNTITTFSQM